MLRVLLDPADGVGARGAREVAARGDARHGTTHELAGDALPAQALVHEGVVDLHDAGLHHGEGHLGKHVPAVVQVLNAVALHHKVHAVSLGQRSNTAIVSQDNG